MHGNLIDLTEKRFGKWIVIRFFGKNKWGAILWLCQCDCGQKRVLYGGSLRSGDSRGCKNCQMQRQTTHGQWKTRLYHIWTDMIGRCENPNHKAYKWYKGRGISVYPEWHDPASFIAWASANGYEEGLSIDRIDNSKGYFPKNCQFITRSENSWKSWHIDGSHGEKYLVAS